ncbi:hypothetical protein [Flammeovirga sp. SubArs3]|uniref:hypothetical protein n=1 Tax=Flammeovirga sp. SubArs3 TaxID=2995316 RepID=UPI00248B37CC|nr:hypothetical protein [Flammeovirga sp. SubArs3]
MKKTQTFILLTLLLFGLVSVIKTEIMMSNSSIRYSIGSIEKVNLPHIKYSYSYQNKIFSRVVRKYKNDIQLNDKFLIKIYVDDPSVSDIYLGEKISQDKIINIPSEGWKEIPSFFSKKKNLDFI